MLIDLNLLSDLVVAENCTWKNYPSKIDLQQILFIFYTKYRKYYLKNYIYYLLKNIIILLLLFQLNILLFYYCISMKYIIIYYYFNKNIIKKILLKNIIYWMACEMMKIYCRLFSLSGLRTDLMSKMLIPSCCSSFSTSSIYAHRVL